jgi:protein phosphatase 1 regulatory subunit 7
LTGLEELWLGKNKITEIKGLDTLQNLKILSIQSNRLTSISLPHLPQLEELHISHNLLTSTTGLQHNTSLSVIDISSNPIEHLTDLSPLTKLKEFWASNCKLESFAEVERELGGCEDLETVYFEGNPLQRSQPALYRNKVKLALPRVVQIDASKSSSALSSSIRRRSDRDEGGIEIVIGRIVLMLDSIRESNIGKHSSRLYGLLRRVKKVSAL